MRPVSKFATVKNEDQERVIVVGSGPSGAMAAAELVRLGARVTVLEAGGKMPRGLLVRAFGRTLFKAGSAALRTPPIVARGGETVWYSELAPGGLSNHWTGAVPRYAPEDFTGTAAAGEEYRWPLTYEELAPYYARAERFLAISGTPIDQPAVPAGEVAHTVTLPREWERVSRAAEARGSAAFPAPIAAGPNWRVHARQAGFQSFHSMLAKLESKGEITVRRNAQVTRIAIDADGRPCVEGVDGETETEFGLRAAAVVLACGAINTPRILLQSASAQAPKGLGNAAGNAGAYLFDHPQVFFAFALKQAMPRLRHVALLSREPYKYSAPMSGVQITLGARMSRADRVLSTLSWPTRVVGGVGFGSMIPERTNCVRLAGPQTGPDALIEIDLHYPDAAIANLRRAVLRTGEILDDAGLEPRLIGASDTFVAGSSVHYGGTARMHESPEFGVTDPWGALHENSRVVIADASVFTACAEKNPTLTAMALGARAAEHLVWRLKGKA